MKNREFLKILERELEINSLMIQLKTLTTSETADLMIQRSNIKDMIISVLKNELVIQENKNKTVKVA